MVLYNKNTSNIQGNFEFEKNHSETVLKKMTDNIPLHLNSFASLVSMLRYNVERGNFSSSYVMS